MYETGRLVKGLKALADEKRLQIVSLLRRRSVCVCELEGLLNMTQPAVSHHLKILREAGLVSDRRQGKWIFYTLNQENYAGLITSLAALPAGNEGKGLENVQEICRACERQ